MMNEEESKAVGNGNKQTPTGTSCLPPVTSLTLQAESLQKLISEGNGGEGVPSPSHAEDFSKGKYIPPQRRVKSLSDEVKETGSGYDENCGSSPFHDQLSSSHSNGIFSSVPPPSVALQSKVFSAATNRNNSARAQFSFASKEEMINSIKAKFCTFGGTEPSISVKGNENEKAKESAEYKGVGVHLNSLQLTEKNDDSVCNNNVIGTNIAECLETLSVGNRSVELLKESDGHAVCQIDAFKDPASISGMTANADAVDLSGMLKPDPPIASIDNISTNAFTISPTPVVVASRVTSPIASTLTNITAPVGTIPMFNSEDKSVPLLPIDNPTAATPLVSTTQQNSGNNEANVTKPTNSRTPIHQLMLLHQQQLSKKREEALAQKQKEMERNVARPLFNRENVDPKIFEQTQALPIYRKKDELIQLIRNNQFVIVVGETGCGKSTQIPQYVAEAGLLGNGIIGVTQPRRVAAKSLASRVADECGVNLGTVVGYNVRFQKNVSSDTIIKYMTDGMLVRECTSSESGLDEYSIIMIDEAHDRRINTDVCLGLLKQVAIRRPELKVIISSATLKKEKFSQFFNNAPIFEVPGKSYNVQIMYSPYKFHNPIDHIQKLVDTILRINRNEPRGDILVFLPGQGEIEDVWEKLEAQGKAYNPAYEDKLIITPCYGELPLEDQQKIFDETPANSRKVVLATNIAETSITIDGIVYVVDSGLFRQRRYNPNSGIYALVKREITKFQAIQRAGRAGRTCDGKCYRLYTEEECHNMEDTEEPEINRCSLESMILTIIALGISDPQDFDYMDPPPLDAVIKAIIHLEELAAIKISGDGIKITALGQRMVEFPLDPPLAKVVIQSEELGCSSEVLRIVALLTFQNIFWRNKKNWRKADEAKKEFNNPDSDLLTLLNVYKAWENNNYSKDWCKSHYIHYHRMVEAEEIRIQIRTILRSRGISENYNNSGSVCKSINLNENIRRAFTAGYFRQLAKKGLMTYVILGDENMEDKEHAYIDKLSSVVGSQQSWVIYQEIMTTKNTYIRKVTSIDPYWIAEYAPEFAKKVVVFGVPV